MAYESDQFRFPMGQAGQVAIAALKDAVRDYMRYAPNADLGEASHRENLHSAFLIVRSRLNDGASIYQANGRLWRIAESMRDM